METTIDTLTVRQIVDELTKDNIKTNQEYQRGEVWTREQEMRLIDSVLRGYQLPIFYLHRIKQTNAFGDEWNVHQIIDGQQRSNALRKFVRGDFSLHNVEDEKSRYPVFLRNTDQYPCPWSGKNFDTLPQEWRDKLLNTQLSVAFISDADDNEVRDLFVRLQSGSPLNSQEKRDSYPGQFTDFILKLGGKPTLGYDGYDFFTKILKLKPGTDRGKTRQLAAQIAFLFFERQKHGFDHISEATRAKIDEYYDTQLAFNASSPECQRLLQIIDKLNTLLINWKGPKLVAHNAIHLVLFVDSIWDDYSQTWEEGFLSALEQFSKLYVAGREANKKGEFHEAWQEYGQWARTNSDSAESIRRRHRYFSDRMVEFLADSLVPKDQTRAFSDFERQFIYWRDSTQCQVCHQKVAWDIAEIHHVKQHKDGGRTVIDNGVLVHDYCHPKGKAADEFAEHHQTAKPAKQTFPTVQSS